MLSCYALKKFKELYKNEFGVEISEEEALQEASRLLELYKAVYGDPTKPEKEEEI